MSKMGQSGGAVDGGKRRKRATQRCGSWSADGADVRGCRIDAVADTLSGLLESRHRGWRAPAAWGLVSAAAGGDARWSS